jgi:hypothetical protein
LEDDASSLPAVRINVLRNDSDREHDALTVVSVGAPRVGSVTLEEDSGVMIYRTQDAEVKNDSFTYTVSDGKGGVTTAHVIIRTSSKGEFQGDVISTKGEVFGDPGTPIGRVSVQVNGHRAARGTVVLHGKTYAFTGAFNEHNRLGALMGSGSNSSETVRLQLLLQEDGAGWRLEASIRKGYLSSTAVCNRTEGAMKARK